MLGEFPRFKTSFVDRELTFALVSQQAQLDGRPSSLPHGTVLEPCRRGVLPEHSRLPTNRADPSAHQNQAVDRVYRLGQTKPVQTVRFVIDGSIEDRMLE